MIKGILKIVSLVLTAVIIILIYVCFFTKDDEIRTGLESKLKKELSKDTIKNTELYGD